MGRRRGREGRGWFSNAAIMIGRVDAGRFSPLLSPSPPSPPSPPPPRAPPVPPFTPCSSSSSSSSSSSTHLCWIGQWRRDRGKIPIDFNFNSVSLFHFFPLLHSFDQPRSISSLSFIIPLRKGGEKGAKRGP